MWLAPWLLAFILTDLMSVSMLRVISNIISDAWWFVRFFLFRCNAALQP